MENRDLDFFEFRMQPKHMGRQRRHTFYQLLFVRQGRFSCQTGSRQYPCVETGDILLFPPGTRYSLSSPEADAPLFAVLRIAPDFWAQMVSLWPRLDYGFRQVEKRQSHLLHSSYATWSGLFSVLDMALSEQRARDFGCEVTLPLLLMSLMMHIGRTYYYQDKICFGTEKRILDEQIAAYVDLNIRQKLTLEATARQFHVCCETVSRLFRHKFGCTFHQYVQSQRLVIAKNAILSGIPLKFVWEQAGFSDYSCFYRAFKKEYGIAPRIYYKRHTKAQKALIEEKKKES